jgi:cytochrome c-type biogenesis protein
MNYRILLICAGLLLLAIVVGALRGRHATPVYSVKTPIDFTARDLNGNLVTLSSYRGKVVVVDCWATWCGYCVGELPDLIAAQQRATQTGAPLQYLGIAMDDNIADVRQFVARTHFNYPIVYKDNVPMLPFAAVDAFPTKFIIDKQGNLVDKIVGAEPMDTISQHVAPYLK